MKIYVTGASGALGSEIAAHLDATGAEVIAVARRPCPTLPLDHPGQRRVADLHDGEWLDAGDTEAVIVHCAGPSNAREDFPNFAAAARTYVLPPIDMLERLLGRGWRGRFIFISSGGAIYGDTDVLPIPETHPTNPKSFYGLHKLCLERSFEQSARARGFELVTLRVSNPYGSRVAKPNQGVVSILVHTCLAGSTFHLIGDGATERDYLAIDDLSAAVARAATAPLPQPAVTLNIGSGQGTALTELIARVEALMDARVDVVRVPARHDVRSNVLDCALAREVIGWQATTPLDEGLARTVETIVARHR